MKAKTLLAAVLVSWSLAWSAEYHVNPTTGSDSHSGSAASPFKTAAKAATVVAPGDTVYLHAGRYPEAVTLTRPGTATAPIAFKAYQDDAVIFDGADTFTQWTLVSGFTKVYATPVGSAPYDPGQVIVDGTGVFVKIYSDPAIQYPNWPWSVVPITDADVNRYQYDSTNQRVLLNIGSNPASGHTIQFSVRPQAFVMTGFCRASNIWAKNYVGAGFVSCNRNVVVEDNLITACGCGLFVYEDYFITDAGEFYQPPDGYNTIYRRNTIIQIWGTGSQTCGTNARLEDNLGLRMALNPWHDMSMWAGCFKMDGSVHTTYLNNVCMDGGNADMGASGYWGDCWSNRPFWIGNVAGAGGGFYVEYGLEGSRMFYNAIMNTTYGNSCRCSSRAMVLYNAFLLSGGSGMGIIDFASTSYNPLDNTFAHNLMRGASSNIYLYAEQPQYVDFNIYWPLVAYGQFATGAPGDIFGSIDDFRSATGHDLHGQLQDLQPADMGWDTVTFRVPDAQDPTYLYQMISNGGFELGDPADNSLLPYYWRPGTGDRAEHTFTTADQALLPGGECAYGYTNSGGTVAMAPTLANMLTGQGDTVPHGGKRYAEIQGIDATKICSSGLGFWSACTPTRPGDTVRVTLWVKCKNLVPTGASGLSAFVVFSDQTGQHPQQVDLTGGATISGTAAGWTQVTATAVVPGNTKRMQFFFGLAPATGTLWLDDISIKVQ